jgi:hypothetical protein
MRALLFALLPLCAPAWAESKQDWAVSTDVLTVGLGRGAYLQRLGFEHAIWDHLSLLGTGDLNTRLHGFSKERLILASDLVAKAGLRWRPEGGRRLNGFFAGLGMDKSLAAQDVWTTSSDLSDAGYTSSERFDLYAELGAQWIRPSGFLWGLTLHAPVYADWYKGSDDLILTYGDLALNFGRAW